MRTYLSLGSNLGDREENLRDALRRLKETGKLHITRVSSFYQTEPVDVPNQPWFLNIVVEADCDYYPLQLLTRIQHIEVDLGRKRARARGPRVIDIDILLIGAFVIATPKLTVPHPRMAERRFVLEPMVELAAELRHPGNRRSMRELLGELKGQKVRRAGDPISVDSL